VFDPVDAKTKDKAKARKARGGLHSGQWMERLNAVAAPLFERLSRLTSLARAQMPELANKFAEVIHAFFSSLSGRLFYVTVGCVVLFGIFILAPGMAQYQQRALEDRIRNAETAFLALEVSPQKALPNTIADRLLNNAGAHYLAVSNNGERLYVFRDRALREGRVVVPDEVTDLRDTHADFEHDFDYMLAPWITMLGAKDRVIHYQTRPRENLGQIIEIVISAEPLKQELLGQLLSSLRVTLYVSAGFGMLLFGMLIFFIVRPIQRLTKAVKRFKANPEDVYAVPKLSGRRDEIGEIEVELSQMQEQVRLALKSRARLAALGQAVSKINHDLRNMLTSAQMASDRLAASPDPAVAKALPRLERALDRALNLAQNVLNYGKSDEVPARIQIVKLRELAEAAAEDAGLGLTAQSSERVRFALKAPKGFYLEADPEHLHRLLVNLMRNAKQAIENEPNRKTLGRVMLEAVKTPDAVRLILSDNGPGIPQRVRDQLFKPFSVSGTVGGSGLGLAIARELAQTHGGDVKLLSSGPDGTRFEIVLPLS
jgi:signal transduction histidine kinase